jgi:hypothetical protein
MITKYGMDPEIGLVVYPDEQSSDFSFYKPYSDETAEKIDERVKKYLEDAYDVAKSTILKHKKTIEKIAELLIKREYISGEDFSMMVENPDKIDEFRDTDEIITKAEENGDESDSKTTDEVKKEDGNKGKMKKTEPKKAVKKNTTSKKA